MKPTLSTPLLAAGAATFGALALSGCGAGGSNNPNTSALTITNPTTTTTTTTPATLEIVYVADIGEELYSARSHAKPALSANASPSLEAYTLSVTSAGPTVTLLNSIAAHYGLTSIAIDSTRRYLFALTEPDDPEVDVYSLNSNGSIGSLVTTGIIPTGGIPSDIHALTIAAPTGANGAEYVYAAGNAAGKIYGFKFSSGTLTNIMPTASSSDIPYSLATDPTGAYLYSGGASGDPYITPYVITASTGALTPIVQQEAGTSGPVIVADDPAGPYLYGYDTSSHILYAYGRSASGLSLISPVVTTTSMGNDLAITPTGSAVFLSNTATENVTEATINANGSLNTPTTTATITGATLQGVAVDATGSYVGSLDAANDALVVYPLSGTTLGAPQSFPLTGTTTPIAAVFELSSATPNTRK